MLAINMRGGITGLPSIELNAMNYYNKRFALGFSIRSRNFLSAIIQFRVLNAVNIGLAYDLSINKMRGGSFNTVEIMVSFSSVFGGEKVDKAPMGKAVDECSF